MNKHYTLASIREAILTFGLVGSTLFTVQGQTVVGTVAGNGTVGTADGALPAGIYYGRLVTAGQHITHRLLLVR